MKKTGSILGAFCALLFLVTGCVGGTETPTATAGPSSVTAAPTAAATEVPADVTERTTYTTQQWIAVDMTFEASETIRDVRDAVLDATFTNRSTGTKMVMPGFWNGEKNWCVRFAPTECGIWDYELSCSGSVDLGLTGRKGTVGCNAYKGDLAIYRHGFLKAEPGTRYFLYDDGTPFFYLGDTHWAMLKEEFDSAGPSAGNISTNSHFKYIVDRRVAQGFTVYQSEPIGHAFNAGDGIKKGDIAGFQTCDKYFQYIAQVGLVHANAELIFPDEINKNFFDYDFLYAITRYWVARYAAYPVLWTLGQEVDNDFFGKNGITTENNPYVTMCEIINKVDPYKHPVTGHQENAMTVGAKGNSFSNDYGKTVISEPSSFLGVAGHSWWGVQWKSYINAQCNFQIPRDYWENGEGKVIVNYETRYDYLYTKNYGARVYGWTAFLNGMYGYGYGAADIWCYQSTYSFDTETIDGVETVTKEDKKMPWSEAVMMPTGDQMTYMRSFLEFAGWWNLIPDFDSGQAYRTASNSCFYTAAHNGNNEYVVYLYAKTTESGGQLVNMDGNATYTAQWFDPRTGEYTLISDSVQPDNGTYTVPVKPVADDMVLLVTKNA